MTFEKWDDEYYGGQRIVVSDLLADWKAERGKLIVALEEAKRASDNINELCGYEDVLSQWAEAADKALTDISLAVGAVLAEVRGKR